MRNIFQTMIDKCVSRQQLIALNITLSDLIRSNDEARLASIGDRERTTALDLVKEEIRQAVDIVNGKLGYGGLTKTGNCKDE